MRAAMLISCSVYEFLRFSNYKMSIRFYVSSMSQAGVRLSAGKVTNNFAKNGNIQMFIAALPIFVHILRRHFKI